MKIRVTLGILAVMVVPATATGQDLAGRVAALPRHTR